MNNDIKTKITEIMIKKIFGNNKNKINFILIKTNKNCITEVFGLPKSKIKTHTLDQWIKNNWDYKVDKTIIRNIFKNTEKYKNGKQANVVIENLILNFQEKYPDLELSWPCNQSQFDNLAQRLNKQNDKSEETKDKEIQNSAIRFRRMKVLKTNINDMIEAIIFDTSDSILPTLNHSATGDFFIDGMLFDQKTTVISEKFLKSYAGEMFSEDFMNEYGKWLYEEQGEDRFDAQPRLYIITKNNQSYSRLSTADIEKSITLSNFENKTYETEFEYGKVDKKKVHKAKFKMIVLKEST